MYKKITTIEEYSDAVQYNTNNGAAATSVIAQGGHGYNLLLEAREKFKQTLMASASHYRICVEEDVA